MFPKMGKTFSSEDKAPVDRQEYQKVIATALKRELGGSHRAIKTLMKWSGVSERTAKKWLDGTNAPSGENLVALMKNSNEVMTVVLELAEREEQKCAFQLHELRARLVNLISSLDEMLEEKPSQQRFR